MFGRSRPETISSRFPHGHGALRSREVYGNNKELSRVKNRTGTEEILRCSFCHKSQDAVAKLISSPSDYPRAYICDECVAVCNSILEDDRGDAAHPATTAGHLPKPQEVKSFLDD